MDKGQYYSPIYKRTWFLYLVITLVLLVTAIIIGRWQFLEYSAKVESGELTTEDFMEKFFLDDGKSNFNINIDEYFDDPDSDEVNAMIGSSPYFGSQTAKVKIIAFEDFYCTYCQSVYPDIKNIIGHYGDKILFVYKQFPVMGNNQAALASFCADEQGMFWPYHDYLFTHSDGLTVEDLKLYAIELGLESSKFDDCYDSGKYENKIKGDIAIGSTYGANSTPTFFINGFKLTGTPTYNQFKQIIDFLLDYYNVE